MSRQFPDTGTSWSAALPSCSQRNIVLACFGIPATANTHGRISQHQQEQLFHMSYGRNCLFGENAITKCGGSPIGFAGFEYGLWGIGFGGSPIGYEGSLSRFKVQGNFLVLCSSANFVGYSYHYHQSIQNFERSGWTARIQSCSYGRDK